MNKDSFFKIGSTHNICQDYAISGRNELHETDYAIISDGCSGAEDTDVGSRLISLIAKKNIALSIDSYFFFKDVISDLQSLFNDSSLISNEDCLHATLLLASYAEDLPNYFRTIVVGDGAVVAQASDGHMLVNEYEFESGAPYYLRYELNSNLKSFYMDNYNKGVRLVSYMIDPKGKVFDKKVEELNFNSENWYFAKQFDATIWNTVGIISDGLKSFTCNGSAVDSSEIIKELFSFKSYNGHFVKRRCKKAFELFGKNNIDHFDDFSISVLSKKE